ncbi:MAG TPA: S4 domain-containing protein [Ignavibacteria bacterium]|jgi:ribosome-associated heat shock protein Hsp15
MEGKLRIDKYLWCVRIFKSRTLATEACDGGKVKIEGKSVKPSRVIKPGEDITVQQGYIKRTLRVKSLLDKRVSAKIAVEYVEDITPPEEKEKVEIARFASYKSKYKGIGRPTKKDRRLLNKLKF